MPARRRSEIAGNGPVPRGIRGPLLPRRRNPRQPGSSARPRSPPPGCASRAAIESPEHRTAAGRSGPGPGPRPPWRRVPARSTPARCFPSPASPTAAGPVGGRAAHRRSHRFRRSPAPTRERTAMKFTRITHNPAVMGGKPCIRGLRITGSLPQHNAEGTCAHGAEKSYRKTLTGNTATRVQISPRTCSSNSGASKPTCSRGMARAAWKPGRVSEKSRRM